MISELAANTENAFRYLISVEGYSFVTDLVSGHDRLKVVRSELVCLLL